MKNNGLSGKKLIKNNSIIFKQKNDNWKNTKEVIDILSKSNLSFIPQFIGDEKDFYSYKYIEGKTLQKVICMPLKSTLKIVKLIEQLQSIYYTKNNDVIVHGDLSPVNVVFYDDLTPKTIIDWDGSFFGSKYEDISYICWLWVNIGDSKQETKKYIAQIIEILKYINYSLDDVKNVKIYILNRIKKDQNKNNTQKINQNFEIQKWYDYCTNWIHTNWKYIENEFEN